MQGNTIMRCSWCANTYGRQNNSTAICKGKYNWIYRKINNKDGRSHHFQDKYQWCDLHKRHRIFRMGYQKLLLRNNHGVVIVYEKTHQINSTRNYCTVQVKWPSRSIWMYLHGNNTRNVRITTSGHLCKQLTCTPFAQPWILPSKTHTRIMETYVETYLIQISSGIFWNWL